MDLSEHEKFDTSQRQISSEDEEDPNQLRLLYATFKGLTKRQKKQLLYSRNLFDICWRFNQAQFTLFWDKVFEKMIQAKFQHLSLEDLDEQQSIPKSITLPVYSQLKYLEIYRSPITNIQRLAFIDFNKLQQLTLQQTNIDKFKSLNKLNLPCLNYVRFFQNRVSQFHFERMSYSTKSLIIEIIHFNKHPNLENNMIERQLFNRQIKTKPQKILWDRCKLVKIQNSHSQLQIKNMIRQPKVLRKLREYRKTKFFQFNQQTNDWQGDINFDDNPQLQAENIAQNQFFFNL